MPIMHIALVRWSPEAGEDAADEACRLVDDGLAGFPGADAVHRGSHAVPELPARGYEWGMSVRFAERADLDAYLPDPRHLAIAEHLAKWSSEILVFDIA